MRPFAKLLILAVLLRLLIMPFYFHPDIKTYSFQASFLKKGVGNIYSYLDKNKSRLPIKDEFVYFPLTYYFLGTYQIVTAPLLGESFNTWLYDGSSQAYQDPNLFKYLILLKLPYLFIDLLIGFTLMFFFLNPQDKKRALLIWLFNPFTIILIYVFSNIDVIPVALSLLSILALRKNLLLSALLLAVAAGFKAYPLLFLPFILLSLKDYKQMLVYGLSCLGLFMLIIVPFLLQPGFSQAALVSGLTTRIVFPGLSIGFGETLLPSIISLSALLFFAMNRFRIAFEDLYIYLISLLLLLFSFIHYHIQWLLWLSPFALILAVKKTYATTISILLLAAFSLPLLYEDKFMSVSLLSGISPLYNLLPIPLGVVQRFYDPFVVQSVIHSFFIGGSLFLIFTLLKKEKA